MLAQKELICRNNMCEVMMRDNMGGGPPISDFYDMNQDVYDIARGLKAFKKGERKDEDCCT